jgi:hypothetical protein
VTGVAKGDIPRDAGIGQLIVLFNLAPEKAEQMMGSAGKNVPTTPNPVKETGPAPSPTPSPRGGQSPGGEGKDARAGRRDRAAEGLAQVSVSQGSVELDAQHLTNACREERLDQTGDHFIAICIANIEAAEFELVQTFGEYRGISIVWRKHCDDWPVP